MAVFSSRALVALEKKNVKKYFEVTVDGENIPHWRVLSYGYTSNKDFAADQLSLVLDNRDATYTSKDWYNAEVVLYEGILAAGVTEKKEKFTGLIRQFNISHAQGRNVLNLTAYDYLIRLQELEHNERYEAAKTLVTLETPTVHYIRFSANINGAPSATSITYDNVENETTLAAGDTLYNMTRSYSTRTVSAIDTDANVITTSSSSDNWADNDTIVESTRVQVLDLANENVATFPEPVVKIKNRDDDLEDPLWEGFRMQYETGQLVLGRPINWAEFLIRVTYRYYPTATSLYAEDVIEDLFVEEDGYDEAPYSVADNLTETLSNMTGNSTDSLVANTEVETISGTAYDIGAVWYMSYSNITTALTASDFTVPGGTIDTVDLRYGRIILDAAIATATGVTCNVDYSFKTIQCVDKKTEALTKQGWRKYNELNIGDEILTLNINTGKSEWNVIDKLNIFDYRGHMIHLRNKTFDALVTPDHKWVTKCHRQAYYSPKKRIKLLETKKLKNHYIVRSALFNEYNNQEIYSDDFVKLVGWYVTEGSFYRYKYLKIGGTYQDLGRIGFITIVQSTKKEDYKEIKQILENLNVHFKIYNRTEHKHIQNFILTGTIVNKLVKIVPDKKLTFGFVSKLTFRQKEILCETLIKGDDSYLSEYSRNSKFYTSDIDNMNIFQLLCILIGYIPHISIDTRRGKKIINNRIVNINKSLYCVRILKNKNLRCNSLKREMINYDDIIWCPSVKNRTWLMRRNGKVTFTGNSAGIQFTNLDITYENTQNRLEAMNKIKSLIAPNYIFQTRGTNKIWARYLFQKDTQDYEAKNLINLSKSEDVETYTRVRLFGQDKNPTNLLMDDDVTVSQDTSTYYGDVTNQELTFSAESGGWRTYTIGIEHARIVPVHDSTDTWPIVYINGTAIDNEAHQMLLQPVETKKREEFRQECHSWCTKYKIRSYRKYWIYFPHTALVPSKAITIYDANAVLLHTIAARDTGMNYGEGYWFQDVGEGDNSWIASVSTATYWIQYSLGKLDIMWNVGKFKIHNSLFSVDREDLVTATFTYAAVYAPPGNIERLIDGRFTTQVQTEFTAKPAAGFEYVIIDIGSVQDIDAIDLMGGFFYPDVDAPARKFPITGWYSVEYSPDNVAASADATFYALCAEATNFRLGAGESASWERDQLGDDFQARWLKIKVEELEKVPYGTDGLFVVAFSELAVYSNIVISGEAKLVTATADEDDSHLYDTDGLLAKLGDKLYKETTIKEDLTSTEAIRRRAKGLLREFTKDHDKMTAVCMYAPHLEVGHTLRIKDSKNDIDQNYFVEALTNSNGRISLTLARYPRYKALAGQDPGVV
jgi:hypothetical protein